MSIKNDILYELFKAEDFISGEELAAKFNKSRAAVWKNIKSLKSDGYIIEAVTNKGYRLCGDSNMISSQGIEAMLNHKAETIYFESVDSTNNEAKRMLARGKKGEFIVAASQQSAGRGRQGKSFYSPKDTGVYFSVALRPNTRLKNAVTMTTAAAVCVCRAIEKLTDKKPQIKWVNDVYVDGKKICGILTEAVTNFEDGTVDSVIVGVGINLLTEDFPGDVSNAGCLGCDVSKNKLIAEISDNIFNTSLGKYHEFIDYYRSHSMILGSKIKFLENGASKNATALAIDETGGLEVELENGERQVLRSGEITIRKL